jgi:hypothetical protein
MASLAIPPPVPLQRLARSLGRRYPQLFKSLVRPAQWPEVRLALELRGADYLAIPIPGKTRLLGYHLMTTTPTGLPRERRILGPAAGLALQAIMLPYAPAPPARDADLAARCLPVPPTSRGHEAVRLSEGWARIERSLPD